MDPNIVSKLVCDNMLRSSSIEVQHQEFDYQSLEYVRIVVMAVWRAQSIGYVVTPSTSATIHVLRR